MTTQVDLENLSPPAYENLPRNAFVEFDVKTSGDPAKLIALTVSFEGLSAEEVVHNGTSFSPLFEASSVASATTVDDDPAIHFKIKRFAGWPARPTFSAFELEDGETISASQGTIEPAEDEEPSFMIGKVVTREDAPPPKYALGTAANLSTTNAPEGVVTRSQEATGGWLIAIQRTGSVPFSVHGIDVDEDGPGLVVVAADATLERNDSPSSTTWVVGWLQPSGDLSLNMPIKPGVGGGAGGVQFNPVTGSHTFGASSENVSYDTSDGGTFVFTLPDGVTEGIVHDLRAKGAPAGLARLDAPAGKTIDGVASKYFRAIAAGLAIQSLGGGNYESRMPPIPGITLNVNDFGARQNGAHDDSDALNAAIKAVAINGQVSNGQVKVYVPPCPNGTVLAKRVRVTWDNEDGNGYEGGFCLTGSASDSGATNYYGESFIYLAIPKREGGAGVTTSGAVTVSGRRYVTVSGFPGGTFPDDETALNYRVELSGCSDGDLDGRPLIVKRNSPTSVDLEVPSTIGNGITIGAWRIYDHAIDWHTQNSSCEYMYFQSSGAGYRYRSVFDITESDGAGAQVNSNNSFKCLSSYGSQIDYLFDMARSIVPKPTNPHYVNDSGRSKTRNPPNVDVMTFDGCQANFQIGLLHCESRSKQSRLHRFVNICAALACVSFIKCTPVFSSSLDSGNWVSTISFLAEDCVADACTGYMFHLGVGQGSPITIVRPIYEGVGGFLKLYDLSDGYHMEVSVYDGYHYAQDAYVALLSPFIQAPKRLTMTNCKFWFGGTPPASPINFIEGHTGATTSLFGCSLPSSTQLGGGEVFSCSTNGNAGFWRVIELGCSTYKETAPYYYPRGNRDDLIPHPLYGFASTHVAEYGTALAGVNAFSGTPQAQRNAPFATMRLIGTAEAIAGDYPVALPEYSGDDWATIAEPGNCSAGASIPKMKSQSSGEYSWSVRFDGSPGVNSDTFTADNTTDIITHGAHDFPNLSQVRVSNSGGALPTGLAAVTDYWTIRQSATTSKLASSLSNAKLEIAINFTTNGTGTHTIEAVEWIEYQLFRRRQSATLSASGSLAIMKETYGRWKAGPRHTDAGSIIYFDSIAPAGGAPTAAQSTFATGVAQAPGPPSIDPNFNNKYSYDCTAPKYFVNYIAPDIKSPRATVAFVGSTDGAASRTMFSMVNAAGDNFILLVRLNTIRMRCYVGGVYTTEIDSGFTPGIDPFGCVAVFDGANSRLYVNALTVRVTGTLDPLTDINTMGLGADFLGGRLYGFFTELDVTFRNVPDAEAKALLRAMGTEYGITMGA